MFLDTKSNMKLLFFQLNTVLLQKNGDETTMTRHMNVGQCPV